MNTWWAGDDLQGLPGMPASERVIRRWGAAGKLQRRTRLFGKGWEYHWDSLPLATRCHLCMLAGEPEPTEGNIDVATNRCGDPRGDAAERNQQLDIDLADREGAPAIVPKPADIDAQEDTGSDARGTRGGAQCEHDPVGARGLAPAPLAERRPRLSDDERRRTKQEGAEKFAALPPDSDKRARAKAREWLVLMVGQLRRDQPCLQQRAAIEAVCGRVNAGELAVPAHVAPWIPARHGVHQLTPDTLYRWTKVYAAQGRWGLTDGYGNRAGASAIEADPALYRAVLGQMMRTPQATGRDLHDWLHTVDGISVPPLRSVQRFREHWIRDNRQLWTLVTNPGKWKNHFQVAFGSQHEKVVRLNQVWELDSTPGDLLLTDGRHSVVGCIDLWSRRFKPRVSRTSSGYAVGQVFRSCVLDWGMPDEKVRTDNGQDYVGDYFAGVLRELEIPQELCLPFASEQKGTIERMLKTLWYGVCKLLPGYIGHNVAEREAIRARETFAKRIMTPGELVAVEMSAAELQVALDRWVEHVYHQTPHGGEGMNGLSPVAKAGTWTGGIRTVPARALDSLLAPLAGERTIRKKGIKWDHRFYINAVLAEFIGDPVLCRYDEADIGRLFVYRNGSFLCIAEDPAATGISKAEVAAVARATQNKAKAKHAAELRAIKKETSENAAEAVLRHRAEAVLRHRAEAAGKPVAFPPRETPYSNAALEAGTAAANAAAGPAQRVPSPAQADAQVRIAADLAGGTLVRLPDSPMQRYKRWLAINRDMLQSSGGSVRLQDLGDYTAADFDWWQGYAESSEFRAQKRLAEDFPEVYGLVGRQDVGD